MIAERILEEIEEHREEGRVEGRAEGRVEGQRGLLRGQIVRKFGDETAGEWSKRSPTLDDGERLLELGGLIIDCETGEEFLNRL